MKEIIIHSKHGLFKVQLDDIDFEKFKSIKWCVHVCKNNRAYARAWFYYPEHPRKQKMLHRLIVSQFYPDGDYLIDHIDGNGLNNQRSNLRVATQTQNCQNRGKNKTNTTGFKGVSRTPNGKRFRVYIKIGSKFTWGGVFDCPVEAAKRYNELASQYHGEFAYQNPVT